MGTPNPKSVMLGSGGIRHAGKVVGLACLSNGRICSAGTEGSIRVWNARRGEPEGCLFDQELPIFSMALSSDGKCLAVGLEDLSIHLLESKGGKETQRLLGHTRGQMGRQLISSLCFSPDGKQLYSQGNDKTLRAWDLKSGTSRVIFQGKDSDIPHTALALSPDGLTLASKGGEGPLLLLNSDTGKVIQKRFVPKCGTTNTLAFSPNGKMLAVGTSEAVRLYEVKTAKEIKVLSQWRAFKDYTEIGALVFSKDGKKLYVGDDLGRIQCWEIARAKLLSVWQRDTRMVGCLVLSGDGKWLFSGSEDHAVRIWNIQTGAEQVPEDRHAGAITAVAYAPDGRTVATGSHDKSIRIWDAETGQPRSILHGHTDEIQALAFDPSCTILASSESDYEGALRLWECRSGRVALLPPPKERYPEFLAFGPDGRLAIVNDQHSDPQKVWVLDLQTGRQHSVGNHPSYRNRFLGWVNGKSLAVISEEGALSILDSEAGREIKRHEASVKTISAAMAPDGSFLVLATQDADFKAEPLRVINLQRESECGRLDAHCARKHAHMPGSVLLEFSADGRLMVSAERHGRDVVLWETSSWKRMAEYRTPSDVSCMALRPDGARLALGLEDSSCVVWNLEKSIAGKSGAPPATVPERRYPYLEDQWNKAPQPKVAVSRAVAAAKPSKATRPARAKTNGGEKYLHELETLGWFKGFTRAQRKKIESGVREAVEDEQKPWHGLPQYDVGDTECVHGEGVYAGIVESLAACSLGFFDPQKVDETWTEESGGQIINVSFRLKGKLFKAEIPYESDFLDEEIFDLIHTAMKAGKSPVRFMEIGDGTFLPALPAAYRAAHKRKLVPKARIR